MHCILTGFDPFDGAELNPSQQAVERVSTKLPIAGNGTRISSITKVVLATCCNEAWATLRMHVAQVPSDETFLILMTGLAQSRDRITPERFALNVRNYRVADNRGHQHDEDYIDESAPDALRSRVPLRDLVETLRRAGFAAETSDYAGSFICNETYFRALRRWQDDPRCAAVLFMHFPSPENYAKVVCGDNAPETFDSVEAFAHSIETTAQFLAQEFAANSERQRTGGHSQT